MKKIIALLVSIMLIFPVVFAQENNARAGVTPDSFFYGLDKAFDRIGLALTLGRTNKAEKGLKIAQERLAELQQMVEEDKLEEAEEAQVQHNAALERAERFADTASEEDKPELQNKLQSHHEMVTQIHNQILERQRERMTEEQIEHLEEVFNKIEQKAKEVEEHIDEHMENDTMDEHMEKPEDAGKPNETGQFKLLVSDQPAAIDDFDSLTVFFSEARVFQESSETAWEIFDISNKSADLTELQGDKALELLTEELSVGRYNKIELRVDSVEGIVENETVDVKVPSNKLQIVRPFTIEANETTTFVFDINVVKKGQGGYNLLPVIAKSGVVGEDLDEVDEVECEENSECEEGYECLYNECEEINTCEDNDDCEDDYICEDEVCVEVPVKVELLSYPETAEGPTEITWEVEADMNLTLTDVYYGEMPHAGELDNAHPTQTNYETNSYIYAGVAPGEFNVTLNITDNTYLRAHALVDGTHYWSEQAWITVP